MPVDSDARIKLASYDAAIMNDAGSVACRELDEAAGLTAIVDDVLRDPLRGENTRRELMGWLRQSVSTPILGQADLDLDSPAESGIDPRWGGKNQQGGRLKGGRCTIVVLGPVA